MIKESKKTYDELFDEFAQEYEEFKQEDVIGDDESIDMISLSQSTDDEDSFDDAVGMIEEID